MTTSARPPRTCWRRSTPINGSLPGSLPGLLWPAAMSRFVHAGRALGSLATSNGLCLLAGLQGSTNLCAGSGPRWQRRVAPGVERSLPRCFSCPSPLMVLRTIPVRSCKVGRPLALAPHPLLLALLEGAAQNHSASCLDEHQQEQQDADVAVDHVDNVDHL